MPMYDLTSSIIQYLDTLKTVGYVEESSIVALLIASLIDDCSKEPLKEFNTSKDIELFNRIKDTLNCSYCIFTK